MDARMQDPPETGFRGEAAGQPTLPSPGAPVDSSESDDTDGLAPAEAFKTLGNEIRVAVLLKLFTAERSDDPAPTFSDLQEAAGSDSSAGFAYHLRQLSGHFIRQEADRYVLTPAGRRAAEAIVSGTFTLENETSKAS